MNFLAIGVPIITLLVAVSNLLFQFTTSITEDRRYVEQQRNSIDILSEHLSIDCGNTFQDPAVITAPAFTAPGNRPYFVIKAECRLSNVGKTKLSVLSLENQYVVKRPDEKEEYARVTPGGQLHADIVTGVTSTKAPIVLDGGESKSYYVNIFYPFKKTSLDQLLLNCTKLSATPFYSGDGYQLYQEGGRVVSRSYGEEILNCPKANSKAVYDLIKPDENDIGRQEVVVKTAGDNTFKTVFNDEQLRYNLGHFWP